MTFDFITMAESKYFLPLKISISQAYHFYPTSRYFIYDCGLEQSQIDQLRTEYANVVIIPWVLQYFPVFIEYDKKFLAIKSFGILRDIIKSILLRKRVFSSLASFVNQQEFEIKILNKLAIIKYHNIHNEEPFVFLDADAFLINRFDELFSKNFSVGVTVRQPAIQFRDFNRCRLVNSGVIFFLGTQWQNQTLINAWTNESENTHELVVEQSSLSRLIEKMDPTFFLEPDKKITITHQAQEVVIAHLPATIYNFTEIEKFDTVRDRDIVKILHFKSGRFATPLFKELAHKLGLVT